MRILVFGAAGQLGLSLTTRLRAAGHDVVTSTQDELDITAHDGVVDLVSRLRPQVVANCAAYTDVEGAEDHPDVALDVNAFAVRSMARGARECGAVLVHYSTDFVFEGEATRGEPYTEDDRPNPQSVYASSKLLGEWFAADAPHHYVFRVESLFGGALARSSVDRIIDALADGCPARVFEDRVVSPSYVQDVADATLGALEGRIPFGLYHCVNSGSTTWLGLGRELARQIGADEALLAPVKVGGVRMKAARPQYAALSNAKLRAAGIPMPTWQDSLARYLDVRRRAGCP